MEVPRLHPDTVEEVKQRADLVEVVSEHVVLRKRGKDFQGLCPFHEEKSPSFSVSPAKQLYYCFGCGKGGTAVNFLMEVGQQSFSEVVLNLARRYQVAVKTLEPEQRQELQRQLSLREQLYEILALTANFYQHALRQTQGEVALNYLKSERQLNEETIQKFQLGYAPPGWETLYRYLVEVKRYSVELLQQAGLIQQRQKGSGYYDRFRNRLMIPINDSQGRIIGFGSRTLTDEQPKYLNSPETPLFDKGKTLFALDKARQAIGKEDKAVVVEGYFDAIALHRVGINNTVASMGTALRPEQVKSLLRYTESKQVIFNFDADEAGNTATQRAIKEIEPLIYSGQVQLKILNLPDGKDADEFLKSGPQATQTYQEALANAPLWIDWQLEQIVAEKDLKQADQFEQIAQEMLTLLSRIQDANKQTHYVVKCGQILAPGDSQLSSFYTKNFLGKLKKPRQPSVGIKTETAIPVYLPDNPGSELLKQAESLLLRLYLHVPEYRQEIRQIMEEKELLFSFSHHRFLWQKVIEIYDQEQLISKLQDLVVEYPEEIAQINHLFNLSETQNRDITRAPLLIKVAITSLEQVTYEKHKRYCLEQWQKNIAISPESSQYYFQEFRLAEQKIRKLEQERQFTMLDIVELNSF
ncbi:MAG: DNA primase [Spirulinaceae cyanobacterium]